jgi:uncharacterized protein
MWFDGRIVMRLSPIHGIGTFATHDIKAGELLIFVTGGLVYTQEDWTEGRVRIAADFYNEAILPNNQLIATPKNFHYYINHSSEPNIVDITQHPTSTQYVALRDILADEELTADYL